MAEWDRAAERLNKQRRPRGSRKPLLSAAASRQAQEQKQAQQERALERARAEQRRAALHKYMDSCNGHFGVQQLSRTGEPLKLRPTSIHGEGDKIALPPSVLEFLTASENGHGGGSPWMFRIGLRNPDYQFPASPLLKDMEFNADEDHDDDDDDDERYKAYMDELRNHMYIAVTHGTVVEFTQEEGYVGLPAPMAAALLAQSSDERITTMRTVDPATVAQKLEDDEEDANMKEEQDDVESSAENDGTSMDAEEETTTTPGHLAWGAFDLPDYELEISMIQKLPKGRSARLRPSLQAIQNGFYRLQDIKLVLEQSLIRTRATLSLHDTIRSWHRGKQFDLEVVHVEPSEYGSVSCINTDIEVEFEAQNTQQEMSNDTPVTPPSGQALGASTGRRLDDSSSAEPTPPPASSQQPLPSLPLEPPTGSPNCVTIQLRFPDGTKRQHRFDVETATIGHLWTMSNSAVRLVTRFPRRVWTVADQGLTLRAAGLQPGQELVMVER